MPGRPTWLDPRVSLHQGDVVSYSEMCVAEKMNLQAGMNFRPGGRRSIFLMSVSAGAPYADRVEEDGRVLIYEGHNTPQSPGAPDSKTVDQPESSRKGTPTQNGKFARAARLHRDAGEPPELINVYEKIKPGIWTYNGAFELVDAWMESSGGRKVFKFKLELRAANEPADSPEQDDLLHARMIPSAVKLEVWKRDGGQCVTCGSADNLHFDHILPFSKGGSSLVAENIQLLCARHNLAKSDRIE